MKYTICIIFGIIISSSLNGQLLNGEFDNWTTIDTSGQAYDDLTEWYTNNNNSSGGAANTPNIRIIEGNDIGVSLSTSSLGLDGIYSGVISQWIDTDRLLDISYLSKCDSIYEGGACRVNIYDELNQLIYSESLSTPESVYSSKSIYVSQLPNLQSGLIKIEFEAFGHLGFFEPFQAYSKFNLLNVNANYISTTSSLSEGDFKVYPNPFNSKISLDIKNKSIEYYLTENL